MAVLLVPGPVRVVQVAGGGDLGRLGKDDGPARVNHSLEAVVAARLGGVQPETKIKAFRMAI